MKSQPDEILACPICGKSPTVSLKGIGGHGCWATIKCKPFLGRVHLKVVEGKAMPDRALKYAVESWNNAVLEIENSGVLTHDRY